MIDKCFLLFACFCLFLSLSFIPCLLLSHFLTLNLCCWQSLLSVCVCLSLSQSLSFLIIACLSVSVSSAFVFSCSLSLSFYVSDSWSISFSLQSPDYALYEKAMLCAMYPVLSTAALPSPYSPSPSPIASPTSSYPRRFSFGIGGPCVRYIVLIIKCLLYL